MATQSTRISANARPGIWRPKNSADQPTFSTSWTANHRRASQLAGPPRRQTSHPATAIIAYRMVQTGPKTQAGGFHEGLARPAYQLPTETMVNREPRPAAK